MPAAMFGFGPRLNQVFASRWKAVFWSLGILLTAYCTVPSDDEAQQHPAVAKTQSVHKSPWAKD